MAATTCSGQDILLKMARDVGELKAARVTTGGTTTFIATGLTETTTDFYLGALVRKQAGSSYAACTGYNGGTKTLTISPAISTSANDLMELCWWNADKRLLAWEALNESIRAAKNIFTLDTEADRSATSVTLAQGTYIYSLPAGLHRLLKVGIQMGTSYPIRWFEPFEAHYDVISELGAYSIVFRPQDPNNGLGLAFPDYYSGQPLCLKYIAYPAELTSETDTTRLPLDYFWNASEIYVEQQLNSASRLDLVTANVNVPQIQRKAAEARGRVQAIKPRVQQGARLQY